MAKKFTPSVTLWVKCDRCDEAEHWTNLNEASALEHAKVDGWVLSPDGDLCPPCADVRRQETN